MSNEEGQPLTFSEWVAKRVRAVRKARGWSVKDLAARCQQAGYPELTAGALYVLEGPRPRSVTVDEWLVLAYVLDVPPLTLALPTENIDYSVTPTFTALASDVARWIIGPEPLKYRDPATGEWLQHPGTTALQRRQQRYGMEWVESLPYLRPENVFDDMPELNGPEVEAFQEAFNRVINVMRSKWPNEESRDSTGGAE